MKFLCSHCKAKYQIADERLAGRTLRMTCRSCGQEILLRGDPGSTSNRAPAPGGMNMPSMPSALGAEFQSAMAGSLHPLPPAMPIDEWHVAIDDAPVGPMRREEVARRIAGGVLGPDSLAWREGLDDWLPIRAIAELAVLCPPGPLAPPIGLPPAPIGGRAGAAPAYALEDWAPLPDRSQPHINVSMHEPSSPALATPRGPSMPMMFAVACGFAFLMSALTILGARWLREENGSDAPAVAAAPAAAAPATPTAAQGAAGDSEPEMTIELEETAINNGKGTRPAKGGSPTTGKPKKELTAEQKAMLERMGGSTSANLDSLARNTEKPQTGGGRTAGSLSAEQLRGVVQRGQKNLQRCYESAMRGAGADNTIRLDVNITISPNGNVTSTNVKGQGLPGMNECISRTVKMWRFPNAGEPSELSFPVLFQPGA